MRTQLIILMFLIGIPLFIGLLSFNSSPNYSSQFNQNVTGGICIGGSANTANNCSTLNTGLGGGAVVCQTGVKGLSLFRQCPPNLPSSGSSLFNGDVISIALLIAGAFVTLGFLAGTFGAGSLANIIAAVGIILGFLYFINAQIIANFQGVPILVLIPINTVIGVFSLVLITDALKGQTGSS